MEIWTKNKDYFAWQFTDRERKLPEAKIFIETIKKEFKHGIEWFYFREDKRWLIHKLKFNEFMEIYWDFLHKIIIKQSEIDFDGPGY